MTVEPLDVYTVLCQFRLCYDIRPGVVVYPLNRNGLITVALISSQESMFDPQHHFWLNPDHTDFANTGLKRKSYIASNQVFTVQLTDLRKRIGRIEAELAEEFRDWFGL